MRVHISLDDELVRQIDELVGPRGRSPFIAEAVRDEVDVRRRWERIEAVLAREPISDEGHPWDDDVAKWVHDSRREDPRRVG
jgi:predicted transcriptional regulator